MRMVAWKIGPTFADELRAASVSTDGYSWDYMTGEFLYRPDVTEALVEQVMTVYAAHDPAAQTDPPTVPYPPLPPPATF
jgi:hypothetical protein